MAGDQLTTCSVEKFLDDEDPPKLRWRAEFSRGPGHRRHLTSAA